MNYRFRLSRALILLILFVGVLALGVLSCAQTLPQQQEISVFVYNYDEKNPSESGWVDYDIQNNTGKIVAFPGTKFSRLIAPHEFTIETESYYKLYSFDGKTYSLSNELGKQEPFTGTFAISQKPVLYAFYEEKSIQKSSVELIGNVELTKYVNIPSKDTLSGSKEYNPKIEVKLNDSYTFKTEEFESGRSIPNDWTLTKIKGVNYIQGDISQDKKRLTIYLSGTPYSSQEEVNKIKFEIPSRYVIDPRGEIDSFGLLKGDAENWTKFIINQAPFSMKDTTISMEEYTALNAKIQISADDVPVLRDSQGSTRQFGTAQFNSDILKPGVVIATDGEGKSGWSIEPAIKGITYTVDSLDSLERVLTLAITGIPIVDDDEDWTSGKAIKITMPENVILGASSASPEITENDVITIDTARSFVKMEKMEIAVEENTKVKATKGITIPESSAEEVKITIASGATFNKELIEIGSEIPLDTSTGYTDTSKWKFPSRDGLKYVFGSVSNSDRTLTIKIYGTLKDATPYIAKSDDIEIPSIYFEGGSDSGRIAVTGTENIVWDYGSVSVVISKDGSDNTHTIKGVNNIVFNSGDGANVEIKLQNAKFKAGLTGEKIASWFTKLENSFGGEGTFVYTPIGGASGSTSSPSVLVNVKGASSLAEKSVPKSVELSIPYTDIEGATRDFGSVVTNIWYENDTLKLELGESGFFGHSNNPLNATRENQLSSGVDENGQIVPGQEVQFVLENGQFDINKISSETLSSWFDALKEAFGKNLQFSYTALSEGKDKLNVKVTGVPSSTNKEMQSCTIKIPASAIRGAKESEKFEYIPVQVYYQSSSITATLTLGQTLYGTTSSIQDFNNPISGYRYTPLSSLEGNFQRIRVHLNGGKFVGDLNDESVSKWFASWDGISSSSYSIKSTSSDRTSVDVAISGVLTEEISPSSNYSTFYIKIPSTDIENPDFTEPILVPLYYYTKGGIVVKLGDGSFGTKNSPIKGIRYVSLGNAGVDISVRIENGEFNTDYINDSVVTTWFSNFNPKNESENIIRPVYKVKEKTSSLITINIKGGLSSPVSSDEKSFVLVINKESIKGEFVEDIKDISIYYQTIGVVEAEFDDQNKDKYYGSRENPIQAVSLSKINSGKGVLVKINLTSTTDSTVNTPIFASGLNKEDVSHWFELCKDYITDATYKIEEGGPGKNYAVVRINGGFTSSYNGEDDPVVLSVSIRASDIEGFLPNDVSVKNGFAYRITSNITADVSSSSVYSGSVDNPIIGTNGVALNNGEGYPMRVVLNGSIFSSSINIGKDVASWFNEFTDLSESEINIIEMSDSRDAITIQVKGVLTKDTDDKERAFINIPPDAIEGYLSSSMQVQFFYQVKDKISAAFTDGENNGRYFGTTSNPLSTIQYIPKEMKMKVELTNAKFEDISSSSVEKWFDAFKEMISSSKYELTGGGKDKNYAEIKVTGALTTSNLESQKITLNIPNSDIKDSYLTTDIPLELTYRISDKVSALVSEEGDSNYGSIARPFTGTRHIKVGDTTIDGGKLIRIQLKNAKFVKNLSSNSNISSWFSEWKTFTNATFSIAAGGAGEDFIIIRAEGILTDEVSSESRKVDLIIDKNAIDGNLENDLKTPLYYKTTAEVEAGVSVIGSTIDNVIHGIYGVRLNNGDGVAVRIELKNGAVFGKDVTPPDTEGNEGADVSHWFSSLRRVSSVPVDGTTKVPNKNDESYIVEEGGAGQNYVQVRIKGAYSATVSSTPNSYPIDIVASSTKKADDTYKEDGIYGALPGAVKADLYFINDNYVEANFVESLNYYGSEKYPLDGASYVALGSGEGLIVSLKLTDGVKFKDDKELDVSKWFKTWSDGALVSGSEDFEIINGGKGQNFITIKIKGELKISNVDTLSTDINISYDDIDGFLTSNVKTPLYYRASKKVSVSLDSGSEYRGSAAYPIAEKQKIKFGDGNGVLIRLNFENGFVNTSEVSPGMDVTSWFSSMIATSSGDDGLHDTKFVIERVTDNRASIIIKATGWLLTNSLKGVPRDVIVPMAVIDGSLPQDLTTTAYYCKTNDVTAYVSTSEGFYGSSVNPIQGTRYVNLQDTRGNEGQDIKIYLNGGKFSKAYLDRIKDNVTETGWFNELDPFISNARYTLSYEGRDNPSSTVDPSEVIIHISGALVNSTNTPDSSGAYPEQSFNVDILSEQIANYASGSSGSTVVSSIPLWFEIKNIVRASVGSVVDNNYGGKDNPITGVKYVPLNGGDGVKLHIELENASFKESPTGDDLENTWFEAFRSLIPDSDNSGAKYELVGGGEGQSYVDILIKGALNVDQLSTPYQVNVVIPNNAIDWDTGAEKNNLNVSLYYNTTGDVTAELDTTGLYRGADEDNPIEGVKYIPINEGKGFDVKIRLTNTMFRWSTEEIKNDINNWFKNLTEIKNPVFTVRPLPTDKSYVVVNVQGSLTALNDGSVKSVKIIIPHDAIKAELNADVQLDLYYKTTDEVRATIYADGVDFFGSENNAISGVQYLPLGSDGNGTQVRISLQNATFKLDSETNVENWFNNFKELTNGNDTVSKYSIVDGRSGSNVVVVLIKGALTNKVEDGQKYINIEIPKDCVNGDLDDSITTRLYYETTGVISASLATDYEGTENNPIEGVRYIDIGNEDGATIRIDLKNNAKFSKNLSDSDIDGWFVNFKSVLVAPVDTTKQMFVRSEGGMEGESYVIIKINGALTSTTSQSVDLVIPSSNIKAFLPDNAPIKLPLYYKTIGKVETAFNDNNAFYYGSASNPLKETRFIKFQTASGNEKAQVYLELKNAKFSTSLNEDNVKEWFRSWTNISGDHSESGDGVVNGVQYSIDGGGAGYNYVIIGISGALTLQTKDEPTIYTLIIPASDIKGAHTGINLVEPITANLYYQSDSEAEFDILNSKYTDTNTRLNKNYVGSATDPLYLIQNIEAGSGKGEKIQIEIKNAKFISNDDNKWNSLLTALFEDVAKSFPNLEFEFSSLSADRTKLTINLSGYHSASSNPASQTIPLKITNEMIDGACKSYSIKTKPNFVIYNPSENYVSLNLQSGTIGTMENRIQTYPNTPIKNETGEGVELEFVLSNALFSDACSSNNLGSWFTNLNTELGSDLQFAYVNRDGTGPGTNKLVISVSGQTTATRNDSVNAIIPGNFIDGAKPAYKKDTPFEVPIYWVVTSGTTGA